MKTPTMLKEIHQQPAALEKTLRLEEKNVRRIARRILDMGPRFIMLAARGTSDNAATYAKYLFEGANGIPCNLAAPSITTVYKKDIDLKGSVVIGISQSGEGTDINEVLSRARAQGAFTIGITNTANSAITQVADASIRLRAGAENALAATKTYTAQLLAIAMLSAALNGARNAFDRLASIPHQMQKTLETEARILEIAARYRYMQHCVIIGRGYNYCTVREAALKLMETNYVVAQPFSTADFMHGPIAMAGEGFPVFVAAAPGRMAQGVNRLIADLSARRVETVVVSSDKAALDRAAIAIPMPVTPDEPISPLFYIVPFQFLACFISQSRGIDPDKPRYLKKVTKTV